MFKKWKQPAGTCARCGKEISNGDWVTYCLCRVVLDETAIFHFCKVCYWREKNNAIYSE